MSKSVCSINLIKSWNIRLMVSKELWIKQILLTWAFELRFCFLLAVGLSSSTRSIITGPAIATAGAAADADAGVVDAATAGVVGVNAVDLRRIDRPKQNEILALHKL